MPTQKLSPLLYLAGKNGNGHAASGAEEEEGAEGKRRREKDISGNAAWTPVPDRAGGFNGQVAGPAKPAAKENGGKTVGEDVARGTGGGNGTGARIAEAESLGPVAGLARSAGRLKRRRVLAVGEPEVAALVEAGFLLPKCLSPGACAEWQAHQADAGYWLRLAVDTGYAAHQVAARSGLSQRQLERLWPEWFGLGLGQWLHRVRLTLAAFWLWRGEGPSDVAAAVRYEVFGDLGRAFKRFFAVTITQFQRTTRGMAWVDVEKCFCGWRKMLMAKTPRAGESGEAGVAAVKSDAALTKTRLSGQELKVLVAAEEGLYCKEIADRLAIMESTARQYLHRAYHKLGAANRLEAIRRLAQPPIA